MMVMAKDFFVGDKFEFTMDQEKRRKRAMDEGFLCLRVYFRIK